MHSNRALYRRCKRCDGGSVWATYAIERLGKQQGFTVDATIGHERGEMASHYRECVSDEWLRRVVNTVHDWLFSKGPVQLLVRMLGFENVNRRFLAVFGNLRDMELVSQGLDHQGVQAWMPFNRLARTKRSNF